jgi:hypothetical protein
MLEIDLESVRHPLALHDIANLAVSNQPGAFEHSRFRYISSSDGKQP